MPATSKSRVRNPYPSLRSAMWLYCLALVATAFIVIRLAYNIDPLFLRLITALLASAAFTLATVIITRTSLSAIFGRTPTGISLILSLLIGLAIWVPASWLRVTIYIGLNTVVGGLPPLLVTKAPPLSILIQAGIIIPLCHGFLFWAFIQRAAEGLGKARGALLTAALYGMYGLFTTDGALSSVPAMFVMGLLAAFVVYYTGSAWPGIMVLSGFGFAGVLLESPLFNFIGDQWVNPFSIRWLLIVVIMAFISFILFQAVRLRTGATPATDEEPPRPAPPRRWWLPLVISIGLIALGVYVEIGLRVSTGKAQPDVTPRPFPTAIVTPRSGAPPVVVPPTPTVPR